MSYQKRSSFTMEDSCSSSSSIFQPLPIEDSFSSSRSRGFDVTELEKILDDAEDVLDLDTFVPMMPVPITSGSSSGVALPMEPTPISEVQQKPMYGSNNNNFTMQWNPPDDDTAVEFIKMFSFGRNFSTSCAESSAKITPCSSTASLVTSSIATSESNSNNSSAFKTEQWSKRFQELLRFREEYGHCLVPHNWCKNKKLAQWVKRQRYQHRLLEQNRHSTLTMDRVQQLEDVGFVWNSHKAGWDDKFYQLRDFGKKFGHCNVPSSWSENPSLAVWVKFQRRQYKMKMNGGSFKVSDANKNNTLTDDRIEKLLSIGFSFDPRNTMESMK